DNEALRLQHLDRFADRDRTDLETTGKVVDDKTLARPELASQDGVAQRLIREFLLGSVSGPALDVNGHDGRLSAASPYMICRRARPGTRPLVDFRGVVSGRRRRTVR